MWRESDCLQFTTGVETILATLGFVLHNGEVLIFNCSIRTVGSS